MAGTKIATDKATAILVLGMHRSGTSALTRVINLLGADIGTGLMPPGKGNEKGFWESAEVYRIHERLLATLGRTWFDVTPLPAGWVDSPAADLAARDLVDILVRDFSSSRLWVVKDPRMCRLVPLWRRVLVVCGASPVPVLMVRHPDEVAESLYRMVGEHYRMPEGRDYGRLLWMQYLLEAERETRDLPRSIVTYDGLLKDWSGTIHRLSRELALTWPRGIGVALGAIESFLSGGQRQHVATDESHTCQSEFQNSNLASKLYQVCADDGTTGAKWKRLQQLRKPYDDGMSVLGSGFAEYFGHSGVELTSARALASQQVDQLASLGSELYKMRLRLLQRNAELTQVRAALDEQSTLVGERSKALYEKSQQLQQRDAELAQVRAALEKQSTLVGERSKALYEKSQQLQQRDAELTQVRATLDEQAALVAERSKELYERRLQLQQLDAELHHLREAMNGLGEQEAALEKKCGDYERALGSKQAALEALMIDKQRLDAQLKELQARTSSRRWLLGRLLLGERYRH